MSKRFEGKVVLVTGAASGIGKATAERLGQEGATLMLADINEEGLLALKPVMPGAEVDCVAFDATNVESCQSMVQKTIERFGRIDMLCNIAGIAGAWRLEDTSMKTWDLMMSINLTSLFVITQAAMPALLESRGNVINMASAAGQMGLPYNSAYCAVKAGVIGFSKSVASEFGTRGVRCNAICPGGVQTPINDNFEFPADAEPALTARMMPLPNVELSTAEEIAALIAYVGSDEARFLTGAAITIDGGQTNL